MRRRDRKIQQRLAQLIRQRDYLWKAQEDRHRRTHKLRRIHEEIDRLQNQAEILQKKLQNSS